ncbi:MAG: TIGR00159 family protein [Verrucomicrobia bacterium]|nr:MAG: TIGR00159 family protein [Verrucomicrobiota bacterium]
MILGGELPGIRDLVEILILAMLFYYIMLFFRGTRAAQILSGLVISLVFLLLVTGFFQLYTLNWLLQKFLVYLTLALIIIFQPEIRRALAELGKQHIFGGAAAERSLVDNLMRAVAILSERKIGALIAVEREIRTRAVQETGVKLDSLVNADLLASIFFPHTPLHDGGVIISGNRIVAAGCIFPLSQDPKLARTLGTRHRAAVGLSEETDAVVIVVSEETGTVSVAYRGRLRQGLDQPRLRRYLEELVVKSRRQVSTLDRVKKQIDVSSESLARTSDEVLEEEPG